MARHLEEERRKAYAGIHQRFGNKFEERSTESLQVRYYTKLKRPLRDRHARAQYAALCSWLGD